MLVSGKEMTTCSEWKPSRPHNFGHKKGRKQKNKNERQKVESGVLRDHGGFDDFCVLREVFDDL